jgi:hypothetical protein
MSKKKTSIETARTTLASVKKEMDLPRLTESVRNGTGHQAALEAPAPEGLFGRSRVTRTHWAHTARPGPSRRGARPKGNELIAFQATFP